MPKIIVWKGFHSREVKDLIRNVFHSADDLLILCPPRISDIEAWLPFLPTGKIEFKGEFSSLASIDHVSQYIFPHPPKFALFSTGTEGEGKLIFYSNENFSASLRGIHSFFKDLPVRNIFSYPQPYHVFGLGIGYLSEHILGKNVFVPEGKYSRDDHEAWHSICRTHGNELLTLGTPTHFLDALKFHYDQGISPATSLACIVGGAKVEKSHWHLLQNNLHILNPSIGYGCSEASPGITHLPPGVPPVDDGDVGFVIPGGKLTDSVYEGENVCLAIASGNKLNFPEGKYPLTDKLEQDDSGRIHFLQRNSLVLNRGGEKFSLEEIEGHIFKAAGIRAVAVSTEDSRLGSDLGIIYESSIEKAHELQKILALQFKREFNQDNFVRISQLPVNAMAKPDRQKCFQILSENRSMIPVSELSNFLPHRDKMVWIDAVVDVSEDSGTCLIKIDSRKHYFSNQGVRQSALIEWMAQGFGFVSAERARRSAIDGSLEKAFLVGAEKVKFGGKLPEEGEEVLVTLTTVRKIGPLNYVEGKMTHRQTGHLYGEALIKLFAIEKQP